MVENIAGACFTMTDYSLKEVNKSSVYKKICRFSFNQRRISSIRAQNILQRDKQLKLFYIS
jgi:hypothetical protein